MMKKIKQKSKKNNTKIQVGFTGQKLTNYAGILPIMQLIDKLEIGRMLDEEIDLELGTNIKYSTSQIILATVLGILSGQNRIKKIESFSQDVLLRELLGVEEKLDEDTIANRFKKFTMRSSSEFMEVINETSGKVHSKLGITDDILDIDSSVRGVYGNQEGTQKGYNPSKNGQKSYHPLFGFLNSTKECIRCWLRPGDSYTSNNVVEFMKECLSNLPKSVKRVMVRGDSGFFSGSLLDLLESDFVSTQTPYLIKVKMKNLSTLLEKQYWTDEPGSNFQSSVFEHKCHGWTKSRTFIALRRKLPSESGTLFEIEKYEYFCYVSNLGLSPIDTHHCYGNRGESENWIEAIKNQLFGGCLLTRDFWCNEALLLCSVLAYNLSLWLRVLTDKNIWKQEPATFRSWFIKLAGKLVKTGRRLYLKIYEAYHYKTKWIEIYNRIMCLDFGLLK